MDEAGLKFLARLAVDSVQANRLDTPTPAFIHDGKIVSLESLQAGRSRYRGTFKTNLLSEFATYVKANKGGAGFIDPHENSAAVIFNLGNPTSPGHGDWRAQLQLMPTAGYTAVGGAHNNKYTQRGIVEWAEDWASYLSAVFPPAPGGDPVDTSISSALIALRSLTLSSNRDATHTDRDFGATKTTLEAIEAKADNGLPTHLVFRTESYNGFQSREFFLRLSVISGDKPFIGLRLVGGEAVREAIAEEFKAKLLAAIGDAATMQIGWFNT